MRAVFCGAVLLVGLVAALAAMPTQAAVYFADDFNGYADDAAVQAAGWAMVEVPPAVENCAWTITNPGGRDNPPTLDGTPTTGKFLISDSDDAGGTDPTDTGASHDLHTRGFSTLGGGGGGAVWLHMDVSAQLNNNGRAIFDIDVSTDGGTTWTNAFSRVAPGRKLQGATTRLPTNADADGYYGRLDVDLSALAANQANVKLRVRQFEPHDDWWIAIDNVSVDDVPALGPGPVVVFSEDFSSYTLGQMIVGGLGGARTWTTTDAGLKYNPGQVGENLVNRIGHPDPLVSGAVPFAIIDNDGSAYTVDDYLMTPVLDLTGKTGVRLAYQSEGCIPDNAMRVLLMRDANGNGPDKNDEIVKVVFDYMAALGDGNEEPFYASRVLAVPEADGQSNVFFAWHFAGADDWYWAVDGIQVTAVPEPSALVLLGCGGLALLFARRRTR